MFIGRISELKAFSELQNRKSAALVCILGRRRIGKSTLVQEFAKQASSFIEIQGLGPTIHQSNQAQLDHFATRLSLKFNTRKETYSDWTEAFHALAKKTSRGKHLIFLDEISWMGGKDPNFAVKLKESWDIELKKNPQIILVLCGSVSSWIEENILKNASFEGRISLEINLQELQLKEINQFWNNKSKYLGNLEKILALSVTGGVPKYLEEINISDSIEKNIIRLCFQSNGFLFKEYDRIFSEIFGRKTKTYEKIILKCLERKLSPSEIAKALKTSQNSEISEHLHHLELSGFISRDYTYRPDGNISKLSQIRVKDNYLRFYLKIILPLKNKIEKDKINIKSLNELKNLDAIIGYQFENLLLANRHLIHHELGLIDSQIISSSPYFQNKLVSNKGACQIDLLTHTNLDVFYLCEFKCKKQIDLSVIHQVQKKMKLLKLPRRSSVKPILVYEGEIYPSHKEKLDEFFFKIISFSELINQSS